MAFDKVKKGVSTSSAVINWPSDKAHDRRDRISPNLYFLSLAGILIFALVTLVIVTMETAQENPDGELPAISYFSINNGSESTATLNVTLNNVCTDTPLQYMASESPAFAGATWQNYSTAPAFNLSSGNGAKTVYFRVQNGYGGSSVANDTITLIPPPNIIFQEDCDTWDRSKWSSFWNPPGASNGTWVFDFPAYWNDSRQANRINLTAYGTYEVKLSTSGPRVSGTKWWIFLYIAPDGDYTPTHQELDFAEILNSRPTVSEYLVGFWVNGRQDKEGIGYWYIPVHDRFGINFEDGMFHVFKYVFSNDDLIIYIDDTQIFKWSTDCTNKTALGLPKPPMRFMIGGRADGTSKSDWSLIVDHIKYYK